MVFPFRGPVSTNADDLAKEIERLRNDLVTVAAKLGRVEQTDLWPSLFESIGSSGQVFRVIKGAAGWGNVVTTAVTPGSSGQILQTTGGLATWVGLTSGSLFYGNSSGEITELAGAAAAVLVYDSTLGRPKWSLGSSGEMLLMDGGGPSWIGLDLGELWTGDSSGFMTVLAAGSSGQILQTTGQALAWVGTDAALSDLGPPTTAGGKLVAKSSVSVGWIDDDWGLTAFIDGGGSTISAGVKGVIRIPWDAGWEGYELVSDASGDVSVGIYLDDLSSTPASSANKISSAGFTLSAAQRTSGAPGSSAIIAFTAGDYLTFDVTAGSSTLTWVALSLWGKKLSTV